MTSAIASTVGTIVIVSIAAFSAGCGWSKTRGGGPDGEPASDAGIETICKGSGLFEDPSDLPRCPSPGAPIHDCALGVAKVSRFTSLPSTSTFEAETMTAVDPRPDSSLAYAATIESTVAPGPGPTGTCVTHKQIHVYRSPDLGLTWSDMPGNDLLPRGEGAWATDPDISVGGDGTVYLTLALGRAVTDCNATQDLSVQNVQLWFAPPPTESQDPGLTPAFVGADAAIKGTDTNADHPQIVASPTRDGQVVVSVAIGEEMDVAGDSFFATFQANPSGVYEERGPRVITDKFANLAMDERGDLYVATPGITNAVLVRRFRWTDSLWTEVGVGGSPPVAPDRSLIVGGVEVPTDPAFRPVINFRWDATPALAVATLGNTTTPIVFVAFEVVDSQGAYQIQLAAANSGDLAPWGIGLVPRPSGALTAFHPSLSADGRNNALDLLAYNVDGPGGPPQPLESYRLGTTFYRFDASRLALVIGPTPVNTSESAKPTLADLPSRHPAGNEATFANSLFDGEYVGLATKNLTAVVAWPELNTLPNSANVDLGLAAITGNCPP